MEPILFSILLAWGLVRYGATDLIATVKGTEPPRHRERRQRMALQHERHMARLRQGPTIGQAVAARIADRIAHPKPPCDRRGQRPFRRFMGEWWEDSWNYATHARHRHHERKLAGDLPRQKAARASRDKFAQWRDQRGHRHTATRTSATATGTAPPESAAERTGPIHVVAERLPLPAATSTPDTEPLPDLDDSVEFDADPVDTAFAWPVGYLDCSTPADMANGFSRSIPDVLNPYASTATPEERNTAPMNTHPDNTPASEITNITDALAYTQRMGEQFRSAVAHAEGLAAQTQQVAEWAQQSATSAETSIAGITAGEVTGEAVASLYAAQEQMTTAAARVAEAQQVFAAAQEQFDATAAAFDTAHAAFQRQSQVAEAYAANPDAGSKQFNTFA